MFSNFFNNLCAIFSALSIDSPVVRLEQHVIWMGVSGRLSGGKSWGARLTGMTAQPLLYTLSHMCEAQRCTEITKI